MTHNIPIELQRYVQERIIPQYAGFDKAHQIDHVEKVCNGLYDCRLSRLGFMRGT